MPSEYFHNYRFRSVWWSAVALIKLAVTGVKLKLFGASWLRERVDFCNGKRTFPDIYVNDSRVLAMHDAVRFAARWHLVTFNCLPRSLVLAGMLKSDGRHANVCIGVAKSIDGIASHAWVEIKDAGTWKTVGEPESITQEFTRI